MNKIIGETKDSKIYGYITEGEIEAPFIFDNGILNLLPSTMEEWMKQRPKLLANLIRHNNIEHTWDQNKRICGVTSDNQTIEFLSYGSGSNNNGFIEYRIQRYFIYKQGKLNSKNISGIIIESEEINLFFNSCGVFDVKYTLDQEKISRLQVSTQSEEKIELGQYKKDDIILRVYIQVSASMHLETDVPLTSNTELIVEFSEPLDIEKVNQIIHEMKLFMYFICYRSNITFKKASTFIWENEKRYCAGELHYFNAEKTEPDQRKNRQILTWNILNNDLSTLFQAIADGQLYFEHICSSIKLRHNYGHDRMILIFAAFEREFDNIYGDKFIRSDDYYELKQRTLDMLKNLKEEITGKEKKYISGFMKIISNSDYSFAERLKYAIKDCNNILLPFIKKDYGEDAVAIDQIPDRMNQIRNDLAHCNIGLNLQPLNLIDLRIMELIIYAIRLKFVGISDINIKQGLNDLFGYNIYFKEKHEK